MTDAELLDRYVPIARFNEGEYFLPASVEAFVARAELWERAGPVGRTLLAAAGTLDFDGLVATTRGHTGRHFLHLVSAPLSQADLVAWRLRRDRPRFRAETRLGHVGVLARLVDAGGRLSLLVRGRLLRFLLDVAALTAIAVVVALVVAGLVASWRLTLLAVFLAAAVASLIVNLRELFRS